MVQISRPTKQVEAGGLSRGKAKHADPEQPDILCPERKARYAQVLQDVESLATCNLTTALL